MVSPIIPNCGKPVKSEEKEVRWGIGKTTYSTGRGTHEINGQPATVITRARTGTVPRAVDLAHLARIGFHHLPGTGYGDVFASAYGGEGGRRIGTITGGNTALEVGRTGTQSAQAARAALRGPAAVSSRAARGLGAAFDVVGSAGAGVADVGSAARGALAGSDADAGSVAGARAGTVYGSPPRYHGGLDGVGTQEDERWDEAGEVHREGFFPKD